MKINIWECTTNKKLKRICIIAAIILCLCGGSIIGGIMLTDNSNADKTASTRGDKTVTIVDKETGEEKVVKADSEAAKEAEKNGDVIKETTKSSSSTKAFDKKSNSDKKSSATTNSSSKKPSSPNSGISGSGNGSSSSAAKPAHHHNWQAVYGERTVTKYRTETYYVTICDVCNAENPTYEHKMAHINSGEGYKSHSEARYKQVPYQTTETYVSGYRCSCGATK